jgi:hypothetical protein
MVRSIARVLHLAEFGQGAVNTESLTRAIAWAEYLEAHAQPLQSRHKVVVAFQGGVQPGTVDDHAGLLVAAHLLEGEGAANYLSGETLSAFGVGCFAANPVVQREAGVTPTQLTMIIIGGIASIRNALPDRIVLILFDNIFKFRVALYDYRVASVIVDKRIVFTQRQ